VLEVVWAVFAASVNILKNSSRVSGFLTPVSDIILPWGSLYIILCARMSDILKSVGGCLGGFRGLLSLKVVCLGSGNLLFGEKLQR
jgi:hypothetical protein